VVSGFLVLGLSACGGPDEDVIARVGHRDCRIEDFQAYLEAVTGRSWEIADSRVASHILDQYLEESAFLRSRDNGEIPTSPTERWELMRQLLDEICGPAPSPSADEIKTGIDEELKKERPEKVLIRQLLLKDRKTAEICLERIDAGEDFEEISRLLSQAPNAEDGGLLGWIPRGSQPEEIENVIFSLKKDEISRPVKGPGGYHLFQLLDRADAGSASPEEAERSVRRRLETDARRKHLENCITRAVRKAGIIIFPRHLWFEYSGKYKEDFDAP